MRVFLCLTFFGAVGIFLTVVSCASAPPHTDVEQALSSYFHAKVTEAVQGDGKPCVAATRIFLARFTRWKVVSKKYVSGSCEVEMAFSEPVLGPVLKRFMRESVMAAMKQGGAGSLDERACRIMAERMKKLRPENLQYRKYRRLFRLNRVDENWIVDPQDR